MTQNRNFKNFDDINEDNITKLISDMFLYTYKDLTSAKKLLKKIDKLKAKGYKNLTQEEKNKIKEMTYISDAIIASEARWLNSGWCKYLSEGIGLDLGWYVEELHKKGLTLRENERKRK